jgi:integrase
MFETLVDGAEVDQHICVIRAQNGSNRDDTLAANASGRFVAFNCQGVLSFQVRKTYASMLFVSVWTGLQISELIGLKWRCIHDNSITVEERYCRGDWSIPKTSASAATIGVAPQVIARINRLKSLTVEVRAACGAKTQSREIDRTGRSSFPERPSRQANERSKRSAKAHQTSSHNAV